MGRPLPRLCGGRCRSSAVQVLEGRRRAALLCQLGLKEDTDPALLYDCLEACLGHDEFFVQKAMGWALRAFARVDPAGVRRFVASHEASLSKLTRREALKHVG